MALVTMTATGDRPGPGDAPDAGPGVDAGLVTDLLWALAEPGHHLEHVHARSAPGRIDLVLFHLAADATAAVAAGEQLCRLAVSTSPRLRGWRVSSSVAESC